MTPIGICSVCGLQLFLNIGDLNIPNHFPTSHKVTGKELCLGSGKPPKYSFRISNGNGKVDA